MPINPISSTPVQAIQIRESAPKVSAGSTKEQAAPQRPSDQVDLGQVESKPKTLSSPQKLDTLMIATKVGLSMVHGLSSSVAALVPKGEVKDGVWTPSRSNQQVTVMPVNDASLSEVKRENTLVTSHLIQFAQAAPAQNGKDIYLELPEGKLDLIQPPSVRFGQSLQEAVAKFEPSETAKQAHLSLDVGVNAAEADGKTLALLDKGSLQGNVWTGDTAPAPEVEGAFLGEAANPGMAQVKAHLEVPSGDQSVPALHRVGDALGEVLTVQQRAMATVRSEDVNSVMEESWVKKGLSNLGLSQDQARTSLYQYQVLMATNNLTPKLLLSEEGMKMSAPSTLIMAGLALRAAEKTESPELLKRIEAEVKKPEADQDLGAIATDFAKPSEVVEQLTNFTEIKVNGLPKFDFEDENVKKFTGNFGEALGDVAAGDRDPINLLSKMFGGISDDMKITKTDNGMTLTTPEGKTISFSQTDKSVIVVLPDGERKEIPFPK